MGNYPYPQKRNKVPSNVQVLFMLGLEQNLLAFANNDKLGRKLQGAQLLVKKRAPKQTKQMEGQHE
jgi:hypothetical protein